MSSRHTESPFNAMPPVVWVLAVLIAGIEIVFQLGARGIIGGAEGVGLRIEAINRFAFSPRLWDRMVEFGVFPPADVARLVTYGLVHLGFTHMIFVVVFLLALGKLVAEAFRTWAFVAILLVSSVSGALVYAAVPGIERGLVGGYPPVYGLIGAFTFILWTGLGRVGEQRLQAFTLIAFLLGIQLVFALLFGGGYDWVADLSGFVAGFLLSFVVSPGGWARLRDKLRQR